jgi:hypothetical protein
VPFHCPRLVLVAVTLLLGGKLAAQSPVEQPNNLRYGEVPGFEVLSDRPDEVTQTYVLRLQRTRQLLSNFFPQEFPDKGETPMRVLLYSASQDRIVPAARLPNTQSPEPRQTKAPQKALPSGMQVWSSVSDGRIGEARILSDGCTLLFAKNFYDEEKSARPTWSERAFASYADRRLELRAPFPPLWLDRAVRELLRGMIITPGEIRFFAVVAGDPPGGPVTPGELLPLGEFFAVDPNKNTALHGSRAEAVFDVQAGLFIRWALLRASPARQAAFNRFIALSAGQPPTEDVFSGCFGLQFADMQRELAAQLAAADRERVPSLQTDALPPCPKLELRAASKGEIARFTGEALRLHANSLSLLSDPDKPLLATLRAEAVTTLQAAYDAGDREQRLLAALGLAHVDVLHTQTALSLLESAAQARVVNPRVYLELVRLQLAAILAGSQGPDHKLDPGQVSALLTPVKFACHQTPALPQLYALAIDIWNRSAEPPAPADLAFLETTVKRFPQKLDLAYDLARLFGHFGQTAMAQNVVAHVLAYDLGRETRRRWESLQTELGAKP